MAVNELEKLEQQIKELENKRQAILNEKPEKDDSNRARTGEVQSLDDLLKHVGHNNPQVTKDHYFSLGDNENGS